MNPAGGPCWGTPAPHAGRGGNRAAAWGLACLFLLGGGAARAERIDFVAIPAGEFVMGATDEEAALFELPDGDPALIADERPPHRVRIGHGFELSRTEITQGQWLDLMGTRPGPAGHWKGPGWRDLPLVSVTWFDAQRFVAALNRREKTARYRLPTEAEWEYAARAGAPGNRPFPAEELGRHAWHLANSGDRPQPVGRLAANAWGLHDMLGNAWEWVADRYRPDYYADSPASDPPGPQTGQRRVRRGGSYHCAPHLVRVNYRAADTPDTRYSVIGFRVLRESTDADAGRPRE